jgi:membrane-associated phospholipid phosphatase
MAAVRRLLPQNPLDLLRQVVLFCGAYSLYRVVRGQVYDESALAYAHAASIVHLERSLHLFVEPTVQRWAIGTGWLTGVTSWMYINLHFVVTSITLAFIYLRRNDHFYFVRNMYMVAMGLALVGYIVYPAAPPRLFPQLGFTDSVARYTHVSDTSSVNALFNPYAAVPSMHVCFALMIGLSMSRIVRQTWMRWLWAVYPTVMTFVVVSTANHWIFDVATGALVAAVSAVAAVLFARARPQAWAWAPERGLPAAARAG